MRSQAMALMIGVAALALANAGAAASWGGPLVATVEERDLPPPPGSFVGGFAFDAGGNPVVFDGSAVVRWDGGEWKELYRPPEAVYGAFVKARGGMCYFGESSKGTIVAIDLDTLASAVVETVPFPYDLAFDAGGRAFVSAPSPNSTAEEPKNGFYLVDLAPETPPDLVIELAGYSGPLAFGLDGFLYAATAAYNAPIDVFRFAPEAVARGIGEGSIAEADGTPFARGIPAAYSIVFGSFGLLFAGDTVTGQILALRGDGTSVGWAAPLAGYAAATYLDYDSKAGRLGAIASDFGTFNRLVLLSTEYRFRRATANDDGEIDIADAVAILSFLFAGGPAPLNLDRLDVNDDGENDVADAVYLLSFLFARGAQPPEPFDAAGLDTTADELGS